MAAIESLGIGSDLLTSDLVDNIINADKAAGEFRLETRQSVIDAKISAYGEVQSKLYDFSEAIVTLADSDNSGATKAETSDESILTATATTSAPTGTYAVEVQRIAKAHSLVSESYTSVTEAVGKGELTFSFGTTAYTGGGGYDTFTTNPDAATKSITINDGNNTLQGLRNAINDADFGVKASIVFDGAGYVLQMTSEETGENMSMEVVAKDEAGALATSGLSNFAYNKNQDTPGSNLTQTQQGQDALLNVNGLAVTRSSNEVTELIDGVTLNLNSANVGEEVSITVGADIGGLSENIQEMIDTYNAFQQTYKDLTAFNETDATGSLLLGDSTLRSISTQMRSVLTSTVSGISGTSFRSFSELGIYTDQNDSFKMKFDSSLFLKGLNENREAVSGVFSTQGSTTDNRISFLNESINTNPGTYDIEITQLATQGVYEGGAVSLLDFASPVDINDANDGFSVNLNGKSTAISLTQGSYTTGDDLAAEIQLQINSADDFKDRGFSSTVSFDATAKSFSIQSNTYGSSSEVSITSTDSNVANTLGFSKLGEGEFESVALSTLNSGYFNGYGTSTFSSGRAVDETTGINFSSSGASFDLSLTGSVNVSASVNVILNAGGADLNSDGVYGDRKDVLQAIQTAVDLTALNGNVIASFNDDDKLIFTTTTANATDTIEITSVGSNTSDSLLGLSATDGPQMNGKDPGLTLGANVNFNLGINGTDSANVVSVPAGTYNTGADLATAIQAAINTDLAGDANLTPLVSGATSTEGSRDISADIDFTNNNSGFVLNVNGVEKTILMNADGGSGNIQDIQDQLDAEYGAGVVTAQLGANDGLELITNSQTHDDFIQVVSDGRGANTTAGAVITPAMDFSGANNATFDLVVDGITLNVDVNTNTTGDETDSLAAIQDALDVAILNNSEFEVGDVLAKLDSSNQIIFETVSRDGVKTSAMFGSSASIEIQSADANAISSLGLTDAVYTGGYDAFGMDDEIKFGSDITADVRYEYDSDTDKGQLIFNVGGSGNTVSFSALDSAAVSFLGMHEPDGTETNVVTGLDTEGTINGITAKGNGQYLTAQNGNTSATNGYYVANQTAVESGPLTIDASNESFTIKLDGIEAVITVPQKTYGTGAELATALQKAINENATLEAEDLTVKVDYTDDTASAAYGTLGIISATTGSSSKVEITDINSDTATAYGFTIGQGDGETGKAKDGEIDDSSGIRLKVEGGDLGSRGSVTYISGIADQLKNLLQNFLDPNDGTLGNKFSALEKQQVTLDEDTESFEARIEATEARLKSKFLYNDAIIASLKTTENYLTQQFEAMANANK